MKNTLLVTFLRGTTQTLSKRLKFLLFALILCYSTIFCTNSQTTITSFTQNGETATCLINGGPMTGASISGDIIIADGLDIPINAFNGNTNITSVKAAGNIGSIGYNAFFGSSATFTFNDVEIIQYGAFILSSGDITFNNVDTIDHFAFWGSSGAITFNDVGTIKTRAFYESWSTITFYNVGTIKEEAFDGSSGAITFYNYNVETIEKGAFDGSSSADITIYNGKSKIYVPRKKPDAKKDIPRKKPDAKKFYTIGNYEGRTVKR